MKQNSMTISPGKLSWELLKQCYNHQLKHIVLDEMCKKNILDSHTVVAKACQEDLPVYGVNTGFGKLASTRIAQSDLAVLQLKLLRSHAVGVGEPLSERVVGLILLLKAMSLARGYSGVRQCVIDGLLALYNHGIFPIVPCQGSVGASGDLAPLAHLSLPLIGEGEVTYQSQRMPADKALKLAGLEAISL